MNICVIGGSGFIGTYLIESLGENDTVYNIDVNADVNKQNNFKADVRDLNSLKLTFPENIDVVILLAAEHKDNVTPSSLYYDVNVQGTKNVLSVMGQKNVSRIIFTSSVAVYGLNKIEPNELSKPDPFNDYGKSKLLAENVLTNWLELDKSRCVTIIRPTVIFGIGNKGNVYNLLNQIVNGKFIMIGNGNNKKSMAYVENVVDFINYCIINNQPGYYLYNYADKPDLTTKQLIKNVENVTNRKTAPIKIPYFIGYMGGLSLDIIAIILNKKFAISAVRIKKFCATTQFGIDNIAKTSFKPKISLIEGLEKTILSIIK